MHIIYLGIKDGGPIQSCENLISNLSDKFDFYVLTSDRDCKENRAYENVKINEWNNIGNAKVYYISPNRQNLKNFRKILNEIDYDVLYLNGFFSPVFTQKPLLLKYFRKLKNKNIILTPRGDFTGGCENKIIKKYMYIYIVKLIGLYKNITWHATSELEKQSIKEKFPKAKIYTVSNLPKKFIQKESKIEKKNNEIRMIFISRIFPKKNLKYALEILTKINKGDVSFDIYGPMEDKNYWEKCKQVIEKMPSNVKVKYCGDLEHSKISEILGKYHAFFFPTLGENYGHVIVEAMMNNCLPIISRETTPWDDYIDMLKLGTLLKNKEEFVNIINRLISINQEEFKNMLKLNNEYVLEKFDITADIKGYIELFGLGKKVK